MTVVDTTAPAAPAGAVPYVGLRPFGPEEHDWFYGRDADAQFLVDKILSARLTLLYAPSGVGKSSLLRARVVSALEAEDCRVTYFDAWAGGDPVAALKERLAEAARSRGVSDPLAGSPTLAELVQLGATDGKTVVLILDQFEEFLINHAQRLDPLRKEIAALVKSQAVDARVLISLREEFLAAIEPFRQEILTLFQSTYRLENLSTEDVRKAIVKPAERFGGSVSDDLASRLIADLSESTDAASGLPRAVSGRGPETVATTVDLPMLQLVCEQMWRAAPEVDGRKTLTLDFYEKRLGGRKKILDDHIRSRMPARWRDRLFTATLMRFLAPPSGLKISCSPGDLAEYSSLDRDRIEKELLRLSGADARILRQRDFKDGVRFELQHDALVRHIAPWRDAVLDEAARRKRLRFIGIAVLIVLALIAGERLYHQKEVRDNTSRRLAGLRMMNGADRSLHAGNTFETVASYLLFQERGVQRFDRLKQLLTANQDLLPEHYAIGAPDAEKATIGPVENVPLSMRYNADSGLDVQAFDRTWTEVAQGLNGRWGIPVPLRLQLVPDQDFPRTTVQIESAGDRLMRIDLEPREGTALISTAGAPEVALEFHRRLQADWRPLPALGEAWWAVPRWSLPVWRAAGMRVSSGSAYPAFAAAVIADKDPTILLTAAAAQFMIHRVAQQYPCTSAEVWALRSAQLRQDLVEWVRGGGTPRPLLHPHLVFDTLADLGSPQAKRRVHTSGGYFDALKSPPDTPWPQGGGPATPCEGPDIPVTAFQRVSEWLPPMVPKIRVALGQDLVRGWSGETQLVTSGPASRHSPSRSPTAGRATEGRRQVGASSDLAEPLEHFREHVFKRNGIWLPEMDIATAAGEGADDHKRHFRIAVLDVDDDQAAPVDAGTADRRGIDRLISSLDATISPVAIAWVDAEYVGQLVRGNSRNHDLLKKLQISVTDLKRLLRLVISPGGQPTAAAAGIGSVRDSDWLISSLVFWKAYYEDDKAPQVSNLVQELAGRLRGLQARRDAPVGAPKQGAAAAAIQRGISALERGQLDDAEKSFQLALQSGARADVEQSFVHQYAARWQASRQARIKGACAEPLEATLDYSLRSEVDAWLNQQKTPAERIAARNYALCLLASMPLNVPDATSLLRQKIAAQYGAAEEWPAGQARWFAKELLDHYDPLRDPGEIREQGRRFLMAAIRRLPDNLAANEAFNDLAQICWKPGPRNWCWDMLPVVAEARPNPWTALDLSIALSNRESSAEAQQSLQWLERARGLIAADRTLTADFRDRLAFWSGYARANALAVLGTNGEAHRFAEAQKVLLPLIDSPITKEELNLRTTALTLAHRLLVDAPSPDLKQAAVIAERGLKEAPTEPVFLSRTVFQGLRTGDVPLVQRTVHDAFNKAAIADLEEETRASFLFTAAVGGLMAGYADTEWAARQFIRTGHRYAPLVSMLLSARTSGIAQQDARRLLEERWSRVDRTSWDKRLGGGDGDAWYEMLLGYFAGQVDRREVFDPLRDDATFAASKLANLRVPRNALLTEAHFYDAVHLMQTGDRARALDSLRQVVAIGHKAYTEYDMAVHLVRVDAPPAAAAGHP